MTIRNFEKKDENEVKAIFSLYWTDPEFLKELADELLLHLNDQTSKDQKFFVAEERGEVLGIAGLKKIPDYLKSFSVTTDPVELYIIAVKDKGRGIGKQLKSKLIEEAKNNGFSEILLFSPNTHNESWPFHDTLGFERVGEVIPPEDEVGQVWRKII